MATRRIKTKPFAIDTEDGDLIKSAGVEFDIEPKATEPPPPPARILSFTATPAEAEVGQETIVDWDTADAATVTLNGEDVPANGTKAFTLSAAGLRSIVLKATGADGVTIEARVDVTVTEPAPPPPPPPPPQGLRIDIVLENGPLEIGKQSYLAWTAHEAASLTYNGVKRDLSGPGARQGVKPTSAGLKTFTWVVTGLNGEIKTEVRQWTVPKAGDPPPPPDPDPDPTDPPPPTGQKPTASLTVTPSVFGDGDEVTVNWRVTGADSIHISDIGQVNAEGSDIVNPLGTTTYTLTATNQHGTTTVTAKAEYLPGPRPGETIREAATPEAFRKLVGDSSPAQPGDVILVKPMDMAGSYPIRINGTKDRRIRIIAEKGWRHTKIDIGGWQDGNFNSPALDGGGRFWDVLGFRLTSSSPGPRSGLPAGSWVGSALGRGDGFYFPSLTPGGDFGLYGLYIDNTRNGISWGAAKQVAIVDSCYLRHIGWKGADRTHGPSIYAKASSDPNSYCLITRTFSERGCYYGPRYYGSGTETAAEPASCYNGYIDDCVAWNHGEAHSITGTALNPNCLIDVQFRDRASGRLMGNVFIAAIPNGKTTGPWWERYTMDGWNLSTSVSGTPVWKDRLDVLNNLVIGSDKNGATAHVVNYKIIHVRGNEFITQPDGNQLETNYLPGHTRVWENNLWRGGRSTYRLNGSSAAWDSALLGVRDPTLPNDTRVKWIPNAAEPTVSIRASVVNFGLDDVVPLDLKPVGFSEGEMIEVYNMEAAFVRGPDGKLDRIAPPIWSGRLGSDHKVPLPAKLHVPYELPVGSNLSDGMMAYKSMAPLFMPIEVRRVTA